MSEHEEILFEIAVTEKTVKTLGVELDVPLDSLKIYVNGVDVNRTMKISNLKIVKVL